MKGEVTVNLINHMKSWYLPNTFIGRYSNSIGAANASSLPVHIPILMPLIPYGTPNRTSASLSKSCFCNDSSCKPVVRSSIQTQNYLDIPRYANNTFQRINISYGAELELDSLNGDEKTIHISNRKDPSFGLPYYGR